MPSSTLLRAALALTATGIVSAASIRHVLEEGGADLAFAIGYAFYLSLILIATPRHPPRWSPVLAFGVAIITLNGNAFAVGLYLLAALLGYLATPAVFRPLTVAAFALWTPAIRFFGPEPLAGAFPPVLAFASVLSLINLVAALLDRSARDPDRSSLASGMAMNVGQRFLHYAEHNQLQFARQSPEFFRNIEVNHNPTALRRSLHIPADRRRQPCLIEQRRMQQVRNGTGLTHALVQGLRELRQHLGLLVGRFQLLQPVDTHLDTRQVLSDTVVQLSRNTSMFLVLYRQKLEGKLPH